MLQVAVPGDLEGFTKPFINELQEMKQKQQFDALVPLLRDLTGVLRACTDEKSFVCCYDLLWDWNRELNVDVRFASKSWSNRWTENGITRSFPRLCSAS